MKEEIPVEKKVNPVFPNTSGEKLTKRNLKDFTRG